MTIYSLYIFDRHCQCIYYQDWHRDKRPKPAVQGNLLPAVARSVSPQPPATQDDPDISSPRNRLSSSSGVVVAVGDSNSTKAPPPLPPLKQEATTPMSDLSFDEEAKLVYGVIFSLRNMMKKLSGRDEGFVNYKTSAYKLHLFETLTGYKFVMLSDPNADSLRFALRQLYNGPFMEYVVRNSLIEMDSRTQGIDNESFRRGTDRLVRNLSIFARDSGS